MFRIFNNYVYVPLRAVCACLCLCLCLCLYGVASN